MRKLSLVLFIGGALGALVAGCDNPPVEVDGGNRDAGRRDAAMTDAGMAMDDAGRTDAGMTGDAGDEDAAVVDMDGGMLADGAMDDAAMPDAAMPMMDAGPPAAPMAAGDLVISEIMYDPRLAPDPEGEWIEVHNPGAAPLEMMGCVFTDGETPTSFTVDSSVVVPPGGYVTFAQTTAMAGVPGFTPDFSYPTGFTMFNTSGSVTIACGGTDIDTVAYDEGAGWPFASGATLTLDAAHLSATDNDDAANWCLGVSEVGSTGERGTPGAANDPCAEFAPTFCRLQFPATASAMTGDTVTVYGRVYAAGLTDRTTGTDVYLRSLAQVGWGPDGSDPATDSSWVWTDAIANAGYGPASPGYEMNNDEYEASLPVPPVAGMYDYAYRFSGDLGGTWVVCDTDGVNSDGSEPYEIANAGALTVTGASMLPNIYFSEYVEGSSNNKALEVFNRSASDVDLTGCEVRFFFNGGTDPGAGTIPLTGMLAAGDTLVICDDSSAMGLLDVCDIESNVSFFNGDDAVAIYCSGFPVDVIGQIGFDPGSAWSAGGVSTQNQTLRRMCVASGDPDGSDVFDPSVQFTSFPIDTFDGLGIAPTCP